MKLTVATCQFPISSHARKNLRYVSRQIGDAKERGADVALLRRCTEEVLDFARRLRVWVVLGSTHPLTAPHKPHNSLYMIDDRGGIVDRYDKTFCAGDRAEDTDDLADYTETFKAMRKQVGAENRRFNTQGTIPGITMPATMIAEAANNHVWISCPNSSARESLWPSLFVRPDGVVTGRLRRHAPGVLISEVDSDAEIYDSTVA